MSYHILFFKKRTKKTKPEDTFFSIGKTYACSNPSEALTQWTKEYPKAVYLGMYNIEELTKIKP